jgi:hypothetical protein
MKALFTLPLFCALSAYAGQTWGYAANDTALRGAKAQGETVQAEVGRDLTLASLQDTDTYRSKQSSAGGGFSVGTGGFSANLALSKGKTDSDYRSVNEQSGIYAGEGGFDIQVGKHTAVPSTCPPHFGCSISATFSPIFIFPDAIAAKVF